MLKVSRPCTFVVAEDWQESRYPSLASYIHLYALNVYGLQWRDVSDQGR